MRILLVLLLLLAPIGAYAQTVFAAASLTDALKQIAALWVKQGHPVPQMSFASSSTLARQIEAGAPANIFASADEKWMDYLAKKSLIVPDTRKDLLGNDLVLVEPAATVRHVNIGPGFDLLGLAGPGGRIAVGDPTHVPAGIYAEQALKNLGIWDKVQSHLAPSPDVRSALLLVERGEAPAGIVYGTDAAVSKNVKVAGVFPESSHDPVTYPFAIVRGQDTPQAQAFLAFLSSPAAHAVWVADGFRTK